MTHKNAYGKVLAQRITGFHKLYSVKAMGAHEIKCTENHKFYVREMKREYHRYENGKRGMVRTFCDPKWVECKNLSKKHYIGIAINQNKKLPKWDGVTFHWADGRKDRTKNELSSKIGSDAFWWLIGRYLGDGWIRTQGGIIICCNNDETEEITSRLNCLDFSFNIIKERTVNKIHIPIKELQEFVIPFGRGAENKELPGFVFDLPTKLLDSLIRGYISADGCERNGIYKATSVSRKLIYGMAQIIAKTYKTPYRIYNTKRKNVCCIEGRICNQKDTWELVWKK